MSPAAALATPTPAPPNTQWTATPITPSEIVDGAKSPTGKLTKSDQAKKVPGAVVGQRIRTVYGGVALRLPGGKAAEVLKLPGAVAVQEDKPQQLL
ncbi:hypothetical protein ITP53_17395 [Nonomuraea sp. K274]|uniref:Uncharacterized protein n=1 Tax=Nonomuraea cypriaca TaxID=1187855 RepID=A0A931EZF1_9ACTN|nr:hypothetical protein [Nonomuraea cypriaca]MBF8187477.1 hypothetical protein [Nonomuraea cypriaca]